MALDYQSGMSYLQIEYYTKDIHVIQGAPKKYMYVKKKKKIMTKRCKCNSFGATEARLALSASQSPLSGFEREEKGLVHTVYTYAKVIDRFLA